MLAFRAERATRAPEANRMQRRRELPGTAGVTERRREGGGRMRGRIGRVTVGLVAVALVTAGLGAAAETYKVSATLNAKREIPKQAVKVPNATGGFSGSYVAHG